MSTWGPTTGSTGGSWPSGLGPSLPYEVAPAPAPAGRGRRAGLTAIAGILVMGSLGFAAINLSSGDGAGSPEGAVEAMFDAIDHEDALGVVESLEPSERRLLTSTLRELQEEGDRLGLTDPDADLRGVQGIDLEVRDLELRTEQLADGVVAVELEGSISSSTDLRDLPLGPVIEDAIDRARDDDDQYDDTASDEMDLAGGRLVAVQRSGGWHVSLAASLAEAARREADDPPAFPDPDDAIAAEGAADPEAAVREMIDAGVDLDVERMIELTDPDEAEVLHRYGPILVDAAAEDDGGDSNVEISNLVLEVRAGPDGDKVVRATSLTMTSTSDEEVTTSTYADGCTEVAWEYTDEYKQEYLDEWGDEEDLGEESWLDGDSYRTCRGDLLGPFAFFGAFASPGVLSAVVTEHDGSWYLRPAATVVETLLDSVRALDRDQLQRTVRYWAGEWWVAAPDSFWEACGVDRPAADVSRTAGEEAYATCQDQLPDDYEYDDWPFGGPLFDEVSGSFDEIDDYEPTADEACYSDENYEADDPDAAILACLQDLADQGEIDQEVVDDYRCNQVYDDIGWDEDLSDEELDALYEQADAAYEACLDGEAPPSPTTSTTAPPVTTTTKPAPTTTAPPATTTTRPPATTSTTVPPSTTTTGG